jgi:hypothetical protein
MRTLLILAACWLAFFTALLQRQGANTWSRVATAKVLVEQGTFSVDVVPSIFGNVDKVLINGRFYSDKPPGLALLAAGIYYPLYHMGLRLGPAGHSVAYALITFLLIGGSTLACLVAFDRALQIVGLDESGRVLMTAGLAFATLMLTWSTTLNNHSFAGAWIFVAFYLLLKARNEKGKKLLITSLRAGAAVGLAASADTACLLFVAGFGLYIILRKALRQGLIPYLSAACLTILPGTIISRIIVGDFRPALVHPEFFHYPGSYWNNGPEQLSGVAINHPGFAFRYALTCLAGPNGFLIYNPLLLIALFCAVRLVAAGRPFWKEALLVFGLSSAFMGYFFLTSSNYGGGSYSIRWFVTLIPLLWFFAFPFFSNWTPAKKWSYIALCSFSFVVGCVGLLDPWSPTTFFPGTPAFVINSRAVVSRIEGWAAH